MQKPYAIKKNKPKDQKPPEEEEDEEEDGYYNNMYDNNYITMGLILHPIISRVRSTVLIRLLLVVCVMLSPLRLEAASGDSIVTAQREFAVA